VRRPTESLRQIVRIISDARCHNNALVSLTSDSYNGDAQLSMCPDCVTDSAVCCCGCCFVNALVSP